MPRPRAWLFLRLVALGEHTDDSGCSVCRSELGGEDAEAMAVVVERLARSRLLTLDEDRVELAHDVLIRSWPRLQGWLSEDRDGLRTHRVSPMRPECGRS